MIFGFSDFYFSRFFRFNIYFDGEAGSWKQEAGSFAIFGQKQKLQANQEKEAGSRMLIRVASIVQIVNCNPLA